MHLSCKNKNFPESPSISFFFRGACALVSDDGEACLRLPLRELLSVAAARGSVRTDKIPMMTARRMSGGTRLAVQAALTLLESRSADACVFSSRHGEIERNSEILFRLADRVAISPIDFSAGVHNTASGLLTITAKRRLPASSVSAGVDTFQQALFEVSSLFAAGCRTVLHVDFETSFPALYRTYEPAAFPVPYAVAFLWEKADGAAAGEKRFSEMPVESEPTTLPQSIAFRRAMLLGKKRFVIAGGDNAWLWNCSDE